MLTNYFCCLFTKPFIYIKVFIMMNNNTIQYFTKTFQTHLAEKMWDSNPNNQTMAEFNRTDLKKTTEFNRTC